MTVYLFFDESGDFNFSAHGSRYYFFGALTTRDPVPLSHPMNELRYRLYAGGLELEYFHAAEDRQAIRDQVFEILTRVGGFEYDVVAIEKRKVDPVLHDERRFYPRFANDLLRYVFDRYADPNQRIVVITDRLPVKKTKQAVEKAFKLYIANNLGARPYSILHHSSAAHPCLQAADYCTWAIQRRWRDGDSRSYDLIKTFVRTEIDIFSAATEVFY